MEDGFMSLKDDEYQFELVKVEELLNIKGFTIPNNEMDEKISKNKRHSSERPESLKKQMKLSPSKYIHCDASINLRTSQNVQHLYKPIAKTELPEVELIKSELIKTELPENELIKTEPDEVDVEENIFTQFDFNKFEEKSVMFDDNTHITNNYHNYEEIPYAKNTPENEHSYLIIPKVELPENDLIPRPSGIRKDSSFYNSLEQSNSNKDSTPMNIKNKQLKIHIKCPECNYSTSSNSNYMRHIKKHTGEKPFKCNHCEFRAVEKNKIKIHESIHTGEKPYACTMCNYRAVTKNLIKIHERIHTGEKPYSCAKCNYCAAWKHGIQIHERIHNGEKPYACTKCDYRTRQKSHLNQHQKKHNKNIFNIPESTSS